MVSSPPLDEEQRAITGELRAIDGKIGYVMPMASSLDCDDDF